MTHTAADALRAFNATLAENGLSADSMRLVLTSGYMPGFTLDRIPELRGDLAQTFARVMASFETMLETGHFPFLDAGDVSALVEESPLLADVPAHMLAGLWAPWINATCSRHGAHIATDTLGPQGARTWVLRCWPSGDLPAAPVDENALEAALEDAPDLAARAGIARAVWLETEALHENPNLSIADTLRLRAALPEIVAALIARIASDVTAERQPILTLADLPTRNRPELLTSMMAHTTHEARRDAFIHLLSRRLKDETRISLMMATRPDVPDGSFFAWADPRLATISPPDPDDVPPALAIDLARVIGMRQAAERAARRGRGSEEALARIPDAARDEMLRIEEAMLDCIDRGAYPHLVAGPFDFDLFGDRHRQSIDIFTRFREYMDKKHGLLLCTTGRPDNRVEIWADPA